MKKNQLFNITDKLAKLYLTIPFLIFVVTWLKLQYAAVCCVIIGVVLFRIFRNGTKNVECEKISYLEQKTLLLAFALIAVWVGMSGMGCMVFQNEDHVWRNGMFELLVNQDWPIRMEVHTEREIVQKGFSYYLGFWLPAACIGKVFGLNVGYKFQMIWAVLGIYLFYIILCKLLKRISLWPLVLFVLFSGMDIVGYYLIGKDLQAVLQTEHLEWWCSLFQYSSFTTQLFWVFNQAIPAWLATILIVEQEDNKQIVFVLALTILNCTMPFVGLIPFVIYKIFFFPSINKEERRNMVFLQRVKGVLNYDNIVAAGVIGIISLLYLNKGIGSGMFSIGLIDLRGGGWLLYLLFFMIECGAMWFGIWWAHQDKPMFYIAFVWLAICPLLKLYGDKNFCMRASIPALVVLFVYVAQALIKAIELKRVKNFIAIALLIVMGSVTPFHEMNKTIAETYNAYVNGQGNLVRESASFQEIMSNGYETTDVNENFFFKYLCR